MSRDLIDAYERVRHRGAELKAMMRELRKEEAYIVQQITDTLSQSDQVGFRLDDGSIITVVDHEKKLARSGREYADHIRGIIGSTFGIEDESVVAKIVDAKTKTSEKSKKLKIIKTK